MLKYDWLALIIFYEFYTLGAGINNRKTLARLVLIRLYILFTVHLSGNNSLVSVVGLKKCVLVEMNKTTLIILTVQSESFRMGVGYIILK